MKSPTSTILHSIQALKSKLRSDHLQLQGIRRDFAMGPTKPILQLQQRSQSPVVMNLRANTSIEKNARAKLIEVRKNHQAEIKSLVEKHKKEKQQLIHDYETKIEQMSALLEAKVNDQASYIQILQDQLQQSDHQGSMSNRSRANATTHHLQLCSRVHELICAEMTFDNKINFHLFAGSPQHPSPVEDHSCNQPTVKYEKIVNQLLRENAVLLESVQTLKMENRRLLHQSTIRANSDQTNKSMNQNQESNRNKNMVESRSSQYQSLVPVVIEERMGESGYRTGWQGNKNRLKFSKASERGKNQTDRSFASVGNENIDTSNIRYRNANSIEKPTDQCQIMNNSIVEQEEQSILSEEMKLRTIKHFMKATSQRSTQCQQYAQSFILPQMPIKKGVGIRSAFRLPLH